MHKIHNSVKKKIQSTLVIRRHIWSVEIPDVDCSTRYNEDQIMYLWTGG